MQRLSMGLDLILKTTTRSILVTRIDVASALSALLKSQLDLVNRAKNVSGGAVTTPKKPEERGAQVKIENGTSLQLELRMVR